MACRWHARAARRPARRRGIPSAVPRRRGLCIVRDGVFFFKANAISHSLCHSSFQNQNRTAASCLVDNYGIPLCWGLIFSSGGDMLERPIREQASLNGDACSWFCAASSERSRSINGGNRFSFPHLLFFNGNGYHVTCYIDDVLDSPEKRFQIDRSRYQNIALQKHSDNQGPDQD